MSIATERQSSVSVTVGDREITFESGKLAKQADGAVVVRSGDDTVEIPYDQVVRGNLVYEQ